MKFILSSAELNQLLSKIQNVVPQKPAIPILSHILVEAKHQQVILTATDLTVGMRCYVNAKVIEEGATALPAKRFGQLLREITAPHIEISTNAQEVTEIRANSSRFKLHGMSIKDFPSLPDLSGALHITLKQSELKEVLFRTAFAVSREDNRYVLTGVFLQIANGTATFIGTDGKRLAKTQLTIPTGSDAKGDYIVPLKAVEEISKNLTDNGDAILYFMPDKIAVEANDSILIAKLLSGEYPDTNRVIPANTEIQVMLHREELMSLLRQVALFTTDTNQSVRFSLSDGELSLMANAFEVGEGKVSMPLNYKGPQLDIAFNPVFFLDILRHSKEETVKMGLIDSFNPGVITENPTSTEAPEKPSPLYVIMPMRLSEES